MYFKLFNFNIEELNMLNGFDVVYKTNLLILNVFFIFCTFSFVLIFSLFFLIHFPSNFQGIKHSLKI